ncbi:MAG: hypothetical protein WA984_07315 [Phormidesmis sp.]
MSKRAAKFSISEAEIRAVYRQGEDAVVALVLALVARLAAVEARLEKLENQQKKTSGVAEFRYESMVKQVLAHPKT